MEAPWLRGEVVSQASRKMQYRPNMPPRWSPNGPLEASWGQLGRVLGVSWRPPGGQAASGAKLDPILDPTWAQVGAKFRSKLHLNFKLTSVSLSVAIFKASGPDLGPIFVRFSVRIRLLKRLSKRPAEGKPQQLQKATRQKQTTTNRRNHNNSQNANSPSS